MDEVCLLQVEKISKSFATKVLNSICFSVNKGEIVALLGENGAGKSTLMKIISGIYTQDEGKVFYEGECLTLRNPKEAQSIGVNIIHQELNIVSNRSVAQNIYLGREQKLDSIFGKMGFINKHLMNKEAAKALNLVNARQIQPQQLASSLTTAQLQMVEISRALQMESKIILMDEPTSSLTDDQSKVLIEIIKNLKTQGISVIFTSHRIKEAMDIADRYIILRNGDLVANIKASPKVTYEKIIELMVGCPINNLYPKVTVQLGKEILRVENISGGIIKDCSFSIRKGEVLGFGGLMGAGRSELMRLIVGADKKKSGTIFLKGANVSISNLYDAIKYKIGFVPEDRKLQSLVLEESVRFNMALAGLKDKFKKGFFIDNSALDTTVEKYINALSIKVNSKNDKLSSLSGGNQQKVVLAKWLLLGPELLILDEPTRGVDVGAKSEIYKLLGELVKLNITIILISSDLPELLGLSDRVIVMSEGKIMKELDIADASPNSVMYYAGLNN